MIVNAGVDPMGENIDGGVEISSAPSPQKSSDLERTQAELRETFNAAEKYRRELEFLQKGGDPLDLKVGNAATVSLQSTSLPDQHPEQFVTSEVKGSFAVTASPHGDSFESSDRLVSADNLMLFDGENKFREIENNNNNNTTQSDVALELPKKSYKRRVRSRPNRSNDTGTRAHKNLSSNSCVDMKVNGIQTQKSTLGQSQTHGQPLTSVGHVEHGLTDTQTGNNRDLTAQKNDCKSGESLVKKGFESKSTCSQTNIENELVDSIRSGNSDGNMEGNNVNSAKNEKILNIVNENDNDNNNGNSNTCPPSNNENGSTVKQEEHEESILEKARIIEEKRKKLDGLSVGIHSSESNCRSHWHFVLEEMSWLANDFAQERIWKATAAAQISRKAAYNSRVRLKQQNSIWKQKEVAHNLAESVMEFWHKLQVGLEFEGSQNGVHRYGMKFLEHNKSSHTQYILAQAPKTPDRISDLGITDILWEDNLTEENLFYTVPTGAIKAYRKSIESHLLQIEKTGSSMQEVVDATGYDVTDDIYEEDEGETNTYYLPGAFEGSRSSKPAQKKRKQFRPPYGPKSNEMGHDSSYHERVNGPKRPANSINVSIPTKRVRTASRPRFVGNTGFIHGPNRITDASSGDTNSFQDEQSSYLNNNNNHMEAESVGDYEKQLQFDLTDVSNSNRPKKKKKTKHPHPGSVFENRWPHDSSFQNDQKRRLDTRQFDSNGNSVASQTSNMSNSNKFMKLLVRDRAKKAKSLKIPVGQQGSGSPWSLLEDQALVVLVHDMGANWELISDAINSLLHLKCISRNSKECKDRHKILMDTNGDGADEDSGSSQPYPTTLPSIPEGSARQLFQRLQGPMEEETLKSHFEKIIMISQKQHYRKPHKDNQDPKQLQQPHDSHANALLQVCPNNLKGGPVLTPLDLCDTISPSPDFVPVGYQGPHTAGGLPISNHATAPGITSTSAMPQLPSAPPPLTHSVRDGRYGIPRGTSLSIEEQHRIQQFNQMSARNMQQQQPIMPHSGPDRGARLLPGGPGPSMGVMNRNMAMTRPGFQGINPNPPSMLNPGVPPGNIHSGAGPALGNPVRPMMRPNPNMPRHPQHSSYGEMRLIKERQIHQQRLLQQQFATSNPMMPPVQQQPQQQHSQVPVSSPQSSAQIQQHPVPPPHGLMRGPVKQPPRQQPPPGRQHPPQLAAAKVMKGGGRGGGPVMNGFPGSSQEKGAAASKQSISQQKRYPGQPGQLQTTSSNQLKSEPPSVTTSSPNHRQPQKLASQSQSQSQAAGGQSKAEVFDDSSGGGESQWQQQPSL